MLSSVPRVRSRRKLAWMCTPRQFSRSAQNQTGLGRGSGGNSGAGTLTRRSLRSRAACGPVLGCAPAGHPGGARHPWHRGWSRSRAGSGAGDRAPGWSAAQLAAALEVDPRGGSGAGTSQRTLRGGRGLPAHSGTPGSRPPQRGSGPGGGAWGERPRPLPPIRPSVCSQFIWPSVRRECGHVAHFTGRITEA